VLGVSWLVVLGNTCLHTLLWRSGSRWNLAVGAALVVAALGYGQLRLEQLEAFEREAPAMTVAVAQGNVDQARKWDPLFQEETLRRYRDLSMAARRQAGNLDLLVWPETATPFFFQLDPQLTEQVEAIVKEVRCPVVFGSPAVTQRNGRSRLLNRAYLLSETADVLGYYDKQHLVPFGEYVPYQRILFFVHKLVQAAGDFVAGEDSTPLRLDGRRLGLLICYEAIFPGLAREAKRHGGDVLVNITNDAWFGNSSAPHQHLEMARWRAVENRMPLVRSANTGISVLVGASGRVVAQVPLNEQGFVVGALPVVRVATIYSRWGEWVAGVCLLTVLVGLGYRTRAPSGRTQVE
jgi:apolipoprotein N-acyltransferase